MAVRFRTQDTKANWADKINTQFGNRIIPELREVPQTMQQWQRTLNKLVKGLITSGYIVPKLFVFRLQDTRQIWCRKLNRLVSSMAAGTKPVNTAVPTITGTVAVGQTLTSTTGTWTGAATITYARQWLRDGAAISGATGTTYVVQAADQTHKLSVQITATNSLGSGTATSAQTITVP